MKKVAVALIVLILIFGSGFLYLKTQKVTVAIVSGSSTITPPATVKIEVLSMQIDVSLENISRFDYMLMKGGKPKITSSKPIETVNVVNLTIEFKLRTPADTGLSLGILEIGKGGKHSFELIMGPGEGLKGSGNFTLIIKFHLKVTTPAGMTVVELSRTITVTFTVPSGEVYISSS
ncbi:MAG: hypothetical protein ACTSXW_00240 [Candidatus Baldrarchaeia archaeon]